MKKGVAVDIQIDGDFFPIDTARIEKAVRHILDEAKIVRGLMEIDIIGNEAIHQVNVEFLDHDAATDVLAFEMDRDEAAGMLEGNILVSAEMAAERGAEFGWTESEELLLYVIHGTLHLVGYDDHVGGDAEAMRRKETEALAAVGVTR